MSDAGARRLGLQKQLARRIEPEEGPRLKAQQGGAEA
jgi:hypothetical protein